jgi:hypothetical protein
MHSGTPDIAKHENIAKHNLGFDLAVVDVVGEQKNSVNLKFQVNSSAGISEEHLRK